MVARIEISDISVDISTIYRISAFIEAIFDTENRLQEKSRKIRKCRRYFGEISDSDRNIGRYIEGWETRARGNFLVFSGRYIVDISKISAIFSIYRLGCMCGSDLLCRKSDGPDLPSFSTASLTDLMARFEFGLIQRPRFHQDLKCDPTVRFLIQRPEIKSKLDPTAVD